MGFRLWGRGKGKEEKSWSEFGELIVHVSLFMLSGPTLILLQKYVLGNLVFEYPIFIVTMSTFSRWFLILGLVHTGTVKLGAHRDLTFMEWTKGMLPVGVLECISLATGSAAYLHLSVSFVQMLKAFQPVVLNVLITTLRLEPFSARAFWCIMLVTFGSVLAAIGEVNFTMTGMYLMLVSELAESVKYVVLHYFLRNEGYTLWEGIYFTTPSSAFSLALLCFVFERDVVEQENLVIVQHNSWVFLSLVTLAIITSVSGFGIIKELGSVANKVLVMLRNALLIYPATQLYDEVVAPIQVIGYAITLMGTAGFAFFKVSQEVITRTQSQMDLASMADLSSSDDEGGSVPGDEDSSGGRGRYGAVGGYSSDPTTQPLLASPVKGSRLGTPPRSPMKRNGSLKRSGSNNGRGPGMRRTSPRKTGGYWD